MKNLWTPWRMAHVGDEDPVPYGFHIVPRWRGDHNFMTVLADVRTIPEHIEQTFDKPAVHFEQIDC